MADLDYEFLAREKVAAAIQGAAQCAVPAAEAARAAALDALTRLAEGGQTAKPEEAVRQVCHGALSALLLRDQDLGSAAAKILERMVDVANELHVDTSSMMTWAMEGFARASQAAPASAVDRIEEEINDRFMGAGAVFREARHRLKSP